MAIRALSRPGWPGKRSFARSTPGASGRPASWTTPRRLPHRSPGGGSLPATGRVARVPGAPQGTGREVVPSEGPGRTAPAGEDPDRGPPALGRPEAGGPDPHRLRRRPREGSPRIGGDTGPDAEAAPGRPPGGRPRDPVGGPVLRRGPWAAPRGRHLPRRPHELQRDRPRRAVGRSGAHRPLHGVEERRDRGARDRPPPGGGGPQGAPPRGGEAPRGLLRRVRRGESGRRGRRASPRPGDPRPG